MITSNRNPLVQQLRQLGNSTQERRQQQLFLLEGTHSIIEAIATGYRLEIVCCTNIWITKNPPIYDQLLESVKQIELVSEQVLEAIATTKSPDGIIAVAPMQARVMSQILNCGLGLESIQDPGNLGTLIRTAVAVGIDGIAISKDSVDIYHPKILRATAGQWFRSSIAVVDDLTDTVKRLQQTGVAAIATLTDAKTIYWDYDFSQPSLILLGNEGQGLSPELIDLADQAIKIPLAAHVESLNVGVCGAILLYEAMRQSKQKTPPAAA
jgi:RNA methyltransferase, TrmH family